MSNNKTDVKKREGNEWNKWLVFGTLLMIGYALLLFKGQVSVGGDDSTYLVQAQRFWQGTDFPNWHGAFYPIFLAPFYGIWGMNILAFKLLSLALMVGQFLLVGITFRKEVPKPVWLGVLFLSACSGFLAYYASQTYSEALFMFLQALGLFLFYRILRKNEGDLSWILIIALSFVLVCLGLTRHIGYGMAVAILIYFVFSEKRYKDAGLIFGGIFLFLGAFLLYKRFYWNIQGAGFEEQMNAILYKDYYKPLEGKEDLGGLVNRFWGNSRLFLSKHLFQMFGLQKVGSQHTSMFHTIAFYLLALGALVKVWKDGHSLRFLGLYLSLMMGGTFVVLQTQWDQNRMIIVYLSLLVLFLGYALFLTVQKLKGKSGRNVLWATGGLFFILINVQTFRQIDREKWSKGGWNDPYYGFTPDWVNYLKLCQWAGENLSLENTVLCRKPNMATIYGNCAIFKGLYKGTDLKADSMLNKLKAMKVDYVIMANLRKFPHQRTLETINTIRRSLSFITARYPFTFELVRKVGQIEEAYLFKIHYDFGEGRENKSYQEAKVINPMDLRLFYMDGVKALEQGNNKEAMRQFYYTLKRNAKFWYGYLGMGNIYFRKKDFKKALEWYNRGLKRTPKQGALYFNRSLAFFYMKEIPKAKQDMQKAMVLGYKGIPSGYLKTLGLH